MRLTTLAPAKINVCLFLGPTRDDGRHELVTVMQPVSLADTVTLVAGTGDGRRRPLPRRRGRQPRRRRARRVPRADRLGRSRGARRDRQADPGGRRDGRRLGRRRARSCASPRTPRALSDDAVLMEIAAGLGADVAEPGAARARAGDRRRGAHRARCRRWRRTACSSSRSARGLATADVYREADRLGLPRDAAALGAGLERCAARCPTSRAELVVNELEPRGAVAAAGHRRGSATAARHAGADLVLRLGLGPDRARAVRGPGGRRARRRGRSAGRAVAARTVGPDFAEVGRR